jgi:hypothetical protein
LSMATIVANLTSDVTLVSGAPWIFTFLPLLKSL